MSDLSLRSEMWLRDAYADGGLDGVVDMFDDLLQSEYDGRIGGAGEHWRLGVRFAVDELRSLLPRVGLSPVQRRRLGVKLDDLASAGNT